MPALKPTARPEEFRELEIACRSAGDYNACTVIAISLLTGITFDQAQAMMAKRGRKVGKGAHGIHGALNELGYSLKRVSLRDIISSYPAPHCNVLKNVTTHHPRRFPGCFDASKNYLIHSRGHVAAMLGGEVKDWSINSALRVICMYEVVKVPPADAA